MIRVLIIDDDQQMRLMLAETLADEGFEVVEASDGAEGVRLHKAQPVDIVVTDLIMPGQEGLETIMQLRRENPELPVIAMSGGGRIGSADYLTVARKMGACRVFAKPFSRAELVAAIREVVKA